MTPKIQTEGDTHSEHANAVFVRFCKIIQDKFPNIAHGMGTTCYPGIIFGSSFYYLPRNTNGNGNNEFVRKTGYIPVENVRFLIGDDERTDKFTPGFTDRNIRVLRHLPLRSPKKTAGVELPCYVISNEDIKELEVWIAE